MWRQEQHCEKMEEICDLSAKMVVNRVSMKRENKRISQIIKDISEKVLYNEIVD